MKYAAFVIFSMVMAGCSSILSYDYTVQSDLRCVPLADVNHLDPGDEIQTSRFFGRGLEALASGTSTRWKLKITGWDSWGQSLYGTAGDHPHKECFKFTPIRRGPGQQYGVEIFMRTLADGAENCDKSWINSDIEDTIRNNGAACPATHTGGWVAY
jgi:hypothetical protein